MNIKNKKTAWAHFLTEARRFRDSIAKANGLIKEIDLWYWRFSWIRAIGIGLVGLGAFAAFGQVYAQGVKSYAAEGHITPRVIIIAAIVTALTVVIPSVMRTITEWRHSVFEDLLENTITQKIIRHLRTLDLGRLSDPAFRAVKEDAEKKGEGSVDRIWRTEKDLIESTVGFIAAFGVIMVLDPILLTIGFLPLIPLVIQAYRSDKNKRTEWEKQRQARRRRNQFAMMLEDKDNHIQARLLGLLDSFYESYRKLSLCLQKSVRELERQDGVGAMKVSFVTGATFSVAVGYIGFKLYSKEVGSANIFLLVGALRTFSQSLQHGAHELTSLYRLHLDYAYLEAFFAVTPMIGESEARDVTFEHTPRISLRDVAFSYPGRDEMVLEACHLCIDPGEHIAIVGRNGSGKTTLARMLANVYRPLWGSIEVDGVDLCTVTQKSWHDCLLFTVQGLQVPDLEIEFALTGTSDKSAIDYDRLRKAAEITGAMEFISELEQGFATQIGEDWPGGVGFSTGQLQRLALTGAMYRFLLPSIRIGIFDEAMANCDVETRARFYNRVAAMEGRTTIVILHDPAFLTCFERVILMKEGRIDRDIRGRADIERYRGEIEAYLAAEVEEQVLA